MFETGNTRLAKKMKRRKNNTAKEKVGCITDLSDIVNGNKMYQVHYTGKRSPDMYAFMVHNEDSMDEHNRYTTCKLGAPCSSSRCSTRLECQVSVDRPGIPPDPVFIQYGWYPEHKRWALRMACWGYFEHIKQQTRVPMFPTLEEAQRFAATIIIDDVLLANMLKDNTKDTYKRLHMLEVPKVVNIAEYFSCDFMDRMELAIYNADFASSNYSDEPGFIVADDSFSSCSSSSPPSRKRRRAPKQTTPPPEPKKQRTLDFSSNHMLNCAICLMPAFLPFELDDASLICGKCLVDPNCRITNVARMCTRVHKILSDNVPDYPSWPSQALTVEMFTTSKALVRQVMTLCQTLPNPVIDFDVLRSLDDLVIEPVAQFEIRYDGAAFPLIVREILPSFAST